MEKATSIADARNRYPGWELYKDSETEIRCYAPGEIVRPAPEPEPELSAVAKELAASPLMQAMVDEVAKLKGVTVDALVGTLEAKEPIKLDAPVKG